MRRVLILLAFAVAAAEAGGAETLLANGQVLTMRSGAQFERLDLLVRDGVFVADAPGEAAAVIDLAGRYVIPGLTEMHAHVPVPDGDDASYRDDVLFLWVANGVTRARGMMGHPSHLPLRTAIAAHEVLGPALTISGPSFSGGSARDPAAVPGRVMAQKEAGYDFLKIHPGMSVAAFEALAEAATAEGIGFAGHVTGAVGLLPSLVAGQQTVDHLDGLIETLVAAEHLTRRIGGWFGNDLVPHVDEARIPALIDALKSSGAALVATETLLENVTGDVAELTAREDFAYLPPNLRRGYVRSVEGSARGFTPESAAVFLKLRKRLLLEAFRAGVPVLLGADSPQIFNVPGFAIHRELKATVAAGLTPFEALSTGTVAPAHFFGTEDRWGSIAPGRDADLVVLREDPLADIDATRSIDAVMVRGRYLARPDLDAGLADIRARYGDV